MKIFVMKLVMLLCLLFVIDKRLDSVDLESSYLQSVSCLAHNIYYEANTESLEGKKAVAQVTMNRLADPNRPKTVCGVVFEHGQFAWTRSHPKPVDYSAYVLSLKIANDFLTMKQKSAILGRNVEYYHNISSHPDWADEHIEVARIGNHVFYRK